MRKWRAANPEKAKAALKRWRLANPDKYKEIVARSTLKHAERIKLRRRLGMREAYRRNPEKILARNLRWKNANLGKIVAYDKARRGKWDKAHPAEALAKTRRRQAAKLQAVPPWYETEAVISLYRDARLKKLEVDHIVPLQSKLVCGLHCISNLQLLPQAENIRKANKIWPDQW